MLCSLYNIAAPLHRFTIYLIESGDQNQSEADLLPMPGPFTFWPWVFQVQTRGLWSRCRPGAVGTGGGGIKATTEEPEVSSILSVVTDTLCQMQEGDFPTEVWNRWPDLIDRDPRGEAFHRGLTTPTPSAVSHDRRG